MSSTSFLYHAYGIKHADSLKTEFRNGTIFFHVKTKEDYLCCSACGSRKVIRKGVKCGEFIAPPTGVKATFIVGHPKIELSQISQKMMRIKLIEGG